MNINNKNSVVCILNNNPFIKSGLIKKSFQIFKQLKYKKIVADYARVDGDYISYKQFFIERENFKFLNEKKFINLKLNRQELKKFYTYIFNIRWGLPSDLINYKIFKKKLVKKGYGIELSKFENFDIDDLYDWKIALSVFKFLKNDK